MKTLLLFVALTALTVCSFSQVSDKTVKPMLKADYLKKSKNQKIAGFTMIGAGIVMIGGGILINLSTGWGKGNSHNGLWLSYLGGATTLASIPFFIASSHNKHKAVTVSIENEALPYLVKTNLSYPLVAVQSRGPPRTG